MVKGIRPVWMEVNLDNLVHNLNQIKKHLTPSSTLMGVVKGDGYGHGAVEIARVLVEEGVQRLAVAVLDEAIQLRKSGIEVPVLVLGYTPPELYPQLFEHKVTPTIYSYEDAQCISQIAREYGKEIKIHIKLDTGMGRIGFIPGEESLEAVSKIYKLHGIIVEGIFTHFSAADERDKSYTYMQFEKYMEFINKLESRGIKIPIKHVSNSAATIDLSEMHLDMVRTGIALYGLYPSEEVNKEKVQLKPLASLKARISHVKTIPPGASVGYGRRFVAPRETVIATLPIGYADGYTRMLSGKAQVLVRGCRAPVVGNICMDQCMVDVTDIEGVRVGEEVVLIGSQGGSSISFEELAGLLGTINYEVVTMIGKRVPRVYIRNGDVVKIKQGIGR